MSSLFSYRGKLRFIFFTTFLLYLFFLWATFWLLEDGTQFTTLFLLLCGGILLILFWPRKTLSELKIGLTQLSKGIYSYQMPLISPFATSFNAYAKSLDDFWNQFKTIQLNLENSYSAISQAAQQLENHAETQLTEIKQMAARLRGIHGAVLTFEEELNSASQSASATGILAETGEEGLVQMESIMQEMLKASSHIVTTLSNLQDEVGTINQVIIAIIKIADQSNLLSLNTAIRANKSGIQGKGFAVIADRIREMADQIALATLDIENSVQEIVQTVLKASEGVNAFSEQIRNQNRETDEISSKLKTVMQDTQMQLRQLGKLKEEMQKQNQQISHLTHLKDQLKKGTVHSLTRANKMGHSTIKVGDTWAE